MIVRVSNSGRKPSKKAKEKQKAAWKAWCEKYGLNEKAKQLASEPARQKVNKFGQIERF